MSEFASPQRMEEREILQIVDKRLRGLSLAAHYWKLSVTSDRLLRMEYATTLHSYELFSLNQLSKIVRLNVGTIARKLGKNAVGGRLNPETLTGIAHLRKQMLAGDNIYLPMLNKIVGEGTTLSTVCRLLGVNNGHYYRRMEQS